MINNIEILIDDFIKAVKSHSENTKLGNYKMVNQAYKKIVGTVKKIKKIDPCYVSLISLIEFPDDSVKLWSATLLLPYDKRAEKVLKYLSKGKGFVAFDAKITLKEWTSGNLKAI